MTKELETINQEIVSVTEMIKEIDQTISTCEAQKERMELVMGAFQKAKGLLEEEAENPEQTILPFAE